MDDSKLAILITLATAVLTSFTTLLLFFLKERIENKRNLKIAEQERVDAFKAYTAPLLRACYSLYYRLKEIFEHKAKFLLEYAPNNNYYQYRYISTLYRLCVVLGWVRALLRELAGMELSDQKKYYGILQAIEVFKASLYQSKLMEGARVEYLAKKWNVDISKIPNAEYEHLEEEIRVLIWDKLAKESANFAYELEGEKQLELLKAVAQLITQSAHHAPIEEAVLRQFLGTTVRAISRIESWIYRDWQQAIGDVMLQPSEGANIYRRFEVMGFEQFEDMYLKHLNESQPNNRWISRIDALFFNLDVTDDEKYDARVQQLKNVGTSLLGLIQVLDDLEPLSDKNTSDKLKELLKFDRQNNPRHYERIEKVDT